MAKIGLQRSGIDIDTPIGECVTAGMPEHGGMNLEPNLGFVAGAGTSSLAMLYKATGGPWRGREIVGTIEALGTLSHYSV
jgi:hypothetical protein